MPRFKCFPWSLQQQQTGLVSYHNAFPLSSHFLFPNSLVIFISLWAHSRLTNSCLLSQCLGQMKNTLQYSFKRTGVSHWPDGSTSRILQRVLGHLCLWDHIAFYPLSRQGVRAVSWSLRCNLHHRHVVVCSVDTISSHQIPEICQISHPRSLLQSYTSIAR